MKNLKIVLILSFINFSYITYAQSLYNPRANKKVSYLDTEDFSITFKKSMYGLTFNQNDRMLTKDLQTKIERFMKNTNRPIFKGLGTFTLHIIKRNDQYFVVESQKPEKLLAL